jgi:hypothetical protein
MEDRGVDPNSSEIVTLAVATDFTNKYQQMYPAETKAYFVGAQKLKLILAQKGCIGVRIYNGYDEVEKKKNLVLVGVDAAGIDMTQGTILERLVPCAPNCDYTSDLCL